MSNETKKQSSSKPYLIIIIVLLAALIGVGGYIIATQLNKDSGDKGTSGNIDAEASEWDDNLNAPSEIEGRILVPGYSGARMAAGDMKLKLRIGNPAENTCYLQATLQLEDGTVLFESGLLEPGKGYDEVELLQTLEAGTYNAFVHFQGYTMEEEPQALNSCDSGFVLTVTE